MSQYAQIIKAVLTTFLLIVTLSSFAVQTVELEQSISTIVEKLVYADKIKSSEPEKLSNILIEISDSGLKLSPSEHDYYQYLYAYSLAYNGNYLAAIDIFKNITNSENKELAYRALAGIANTYVLTKQYLDVFYYLDYMDEMERFITTPSVLEQGIGLKAMVYNKLGVYSLANTYSLQLMENAQSPRYKCVAYQLYAETLFNLNNEAAFNQFYDEAIDYCNSVKETLWVSIIHAHKIHFLLKNKNYSGAILLLDKYIAATRATKYPYIISTLYAFYANAYFGLGHYQRSLESANLALSAGDINNIHLAHLMAYESQYKAYRALGDNESALKSLEAFNEVNISFSDDRLSQQKAFYLARGEIETKNQRIALLDKDNELLYLQSSIYEQEIKNQRLMVTLLAVVVFIAIVLAVRGIFGRNRFKILAEFDHLTGISNRYHFNNQAKISLEYCETNNKPVSLILFDLDFFKKINDDYGHATGDWALQKVVKSCRNFMRNNDIFGRIGGEEFSILLPGCQPDKALLLAEICREAISAIDTTESGHSFTLSASFGVSNSITSGYQLKQLLADADHAMYQAKKQGKNQVEEFEAH